MRKLFALVFALATLGANSIATAKRPATDAQCRASYTSCQDKCKARGENDIGAPCDNACLKKWNFCLANDGKIDIRGVPVNGNGAASTKNIPPTGNPTSAGASTKAGAATSTTIGASGSVSPPSAGVGVQGPGVQGSGAPKTI